jgi:hypothetical protein
MRIPSRSIWNAILDAFSQSITQIELTGFLSVSFTDWIFPRILVGRAIALVRVGRAASGDRISTNDSVAVEGS